MISNLTLLIFYVLEDFVCSLPHDSGGCDRKEFRYYYNSLEVSTFSSSHNIYDNIFSVAANCLFMADAKEIRTILFPSWIA